MKPTLSVLLTILAISQACAQQPDAPLEGWTVPAPGRRLLAGYHHDGYGKPKASVLKQRAKAGDVMDVIFLGDAYVTGHTYWPGIKVDVTGVKNGVLGNLHSIRPNARRAERAYREAVESGARNTLAYLRLGQHLLRNDKDHDEAKNLLTTAARAGSSWAMLALGIALESDGEPASSWVPWLERAAHDPGHPQQSARVRLAYHLLDAGREDEALGLVGSGFPRVEHDPDVSPYGGLAAVVEARAERIWRDRAAAGGSSRVVVDDCDRTLRSALKEAIPLVTQDVLEAVVRDLRAWRAEKPGAWGSQAGIVNGIPD